MYPNLSSILFSGMRMLEFASCLMLAQSEPKILYKMALNLITNKVS